MARKTRLNAKTKMPSDLRQWDSRESGPAMSRLSERQRKFVLAMVADPFGNPSRWAAAAGYPVTRNGNNRVMGHHLIRAAAVQEATLEVGRSLLGTTGPIIASSVMLKIAADPGHPKQLRAAEAIANRVGLPEIQEVHVHRVDESLEAKIARIRHVAALLKIDVADLLGRNLAGEAKAEPKLIEGKVVSPGGDPGVVGK